MMRMARETVGLRMMSEGRMRRMARGAGGPVVAYSRDRGIVLSSADGVVRRGIMAKALCGVTCTRIRGLQACNARTPCQFIEQKPRDGCSGFMHLILLHTPTHARLFLLPQNLYFQISLRHSTCCGPT